MQEAPVLCNYTSLKISENSSKERKILVRHKWKGFCTEWSLQMNIRSTTITQRPRNPVTMFQHRNPNRIFIENSYVTNLVASAWCCVL